MRTPLAALLLAATQAAGAGAELEPISVGDSRELVLAAGDAGMAFALVIERPEPLVLRAESCDADVRLRVEEVGGTVLAEEDGGGVGTNAALVWTPPRAGSFVVRVLAEDPVAGTCMLRVHRGERVRAPPEPGLAARAYWDLARMRARLRGDGARQALALDGLDAADVVRGRDEVRAALEARDRVADGARTLVDEARFLADPADVAAARAKLREALSLLASHEGNGDDAVLASIGSDLAAVAESRADDASALSGWSRARDLAERRLPGDHPELQWLRSRLVSSLVDRGDLEVAERLQRELTGVRASTHPAGHRELLSARRSLAVLHKRRGDLAGARAVEEEIVAVYERTRGADDAELVGARAGLAVTLRSLGDLEGARALQEIVLASRERTLAPDHVDLQGARVNLANVLRKLGEVRRARELEEQAVAACERTLPDDHPMTLLARGNLAASLFEEGEIDRAAGLFEEVLAVSERTLPRDHPNLLHLRSSLGGVLVMRGDLKRARVLLEEVVAAYERAGRPEHSGLLSARTNLAAVVIDLGDLDRARALYEQVLEVRERTRPPEDLDLQRSRMGVGSVLFEQGAIAAAIEIFERAHAVLERTLPADHPDLHRARGNLAEALGVAGDLERASALEQQVLDALERSLPEDHLHLQYIRTNVAQTLLGLGEVASALSLLERVRAVFERTLDRDHPDRLLVVRKIGECLARLGDGPGLRILVPELIATGMRGLESARLASPREAAARADDSMRALSSALSLRSVLSEGAELDGILFQWIEQRRATVSLSERVVADIADDEVVRGRREAVRDAKRQLAEALTSTATGSGADRQRAAGIAEASVRRDAAERALRSALAERGAEPLAIDGPAVAAALPKGAVAVGFLAYGRWDAGARFLTPSLLAHVVRADGSIVRVELGALATIREAVARWRHALGVSEVARGAGARVESAPASEASPGESLRALVVDPVLAAAGDAAALHVCLDDALHLVPLDALPLGPDPSRDGVVGDRIRVHVESSLARLLRARPALASEPSILVLGGVDYGAEDETDPPASEPAIRRAGALGTFRKLTGAAAEARTVASRFAERFGTAPIVLSGSDATKEAFESAAPRVRSIHLATHGYFSDAQVTRRADADADRLWRPASLERVVRGMSPMLLCGLAFAGANRSADADGNAEEILTAEELAGLDLRRCELAVLSACETSLGVGLPGLGIASLQAALHAAGVRSAVTSLWRVDDAATSRLMADFYRRLWSDGLPPAEALWQAKCAAREAGAPVRDWAAWVLTGKPDG